VCAAVRQLTDAMAKTSTLARCAEDGHVITRTSSRSRSGSGRLGLPVAAARTAMYKRRINSMTVIIAGDSVTVPVAAENRHE